MVDKINEMIPPCSMGVIDRVAWRLSPDGQFSNATAYEYLLEANFRCPETVFRKIWKWPGPEKFRILLWKVSLEALVTNSWRKRRDLDDTSLCPICGLEEETIIHLVRDCSIIHHV